MSPSSCCRPSWSPCPVGDVGKAIWEVRKKRAIARVTERRGYAFGRIGRDLRGDRDFMLEAVGIDGTVLQYASTELRADKEIVLKAVKGCWKALEYASEELKDDKAIVLEATKFDGDALRFASSHLRADKSIVREIVARWAYALEYASDELRGDKTLVLEAAHRFRPALKFASPKLRADKAYVLEALKLSYRALCYAHEDIRRDAAFVLEAVKIAGSALCFASEELRGNKTIVLEAVKQCGLDAIHCATFECREDKDLLLLAARHPESGSSECAQLEDMAKQVLSLESEHFRGAQQSSIAVRGEGAPILSVTLSYSYGTGNSVFRGVAFLMSGLSFECFIPDEPSPGSRAPILDDLAKQLLAQLSKHSEDSARRAFINFTSNDDGEAVPVTPWDWNRPLADFLPV